MVRIYTPRWSQLCVWAQMTGSKSRFCSTRKETAYIHLLTHGTPRPLQVYIHADVASPWWGVSPKETCRSRCVGKWWRRSKECHWKCHRQPSGAYANSIDATFDFEDQAFRASSYMVKCDVRLRGDTLQTEDAQCSSEHMCHCQGVPAATNRTAAPRPRCRGMVPIA